MARSDSDHTLVLSLGRNGRASYPERPWEEIEPVLRRVWEFTPSIWHPHALRSRASFR